MKKFLSVAFVFVLLFAVSASAEVIEFPSAKVVIDVAAGWEYSDNGEGTAMLIAPDKSASMTVTKLPAQGVGLQQWATDLSAAHGGTTPQENGEMMTYTFNGGQTTVIVGVDEGVVGIIAITGQHADISPMLDSLKDM